MKIVGRIPERIIAKAKATLASDAKKPKKHFHSGFVSLAVNREYRLLKRCEHSEWDLMSHEKYNKAMRKH